MKHPLFIQQSGQGPDLVMLHGWGLHGKIFDPVLSSFEEHFTVHVIDLPGFGRSVVDNEEYNLDYVIKKVLQVAPRNAHWLGWSLGGLIAMAIAIKYPEKVNGLITVAANPRFIASDDWPAAMLPETLDNFESLLVEDYMGTLIRFLAIQTMGSKTQQQDIQYLKNITFCFGEPAPKALRGGLSILHHEDLRAELNKITGPWLRLYGKTDGIVPVASMEAVAELHPNSQQKVINRASHAPFISHPDEFVSICEHFLSSNKPSLIPCSENSEQV